MSYILPNTDWCTEYSIFIHSKLRTTDDFTKTAFTQYTLDRYKLKHWSHDTNKTHSSLIDGVASHCFIDKVATKPYRPKNYEIAMRNAYNSNSCEKQTVGVVFYYQRVVFVQNKCFKPIQDHEKPLLDSTQGKNKLSKLFTI